ncbi:Cytolethal distending toxin subunit A [Campylobacter coli]|nr:Cytolethal distending toxin subunit A [Campylobacter coli]
MELIKFKNFATQQCIQTPVSNVMEEFNLSFYNIYLTDCLKEKEKNLDRQWYIGAPI